MREYIELGPCPCDEDAAACGVDPDFTEKNRAECARYKAMLERCFPIPGEADAYFTVKRFDHDFGGYREVCISYGDDLGAEFAYFVEGKTPATWDDDAIRRFVRENAAA